MINAVSLPGIYLAIIVAVLSTGIIVANKWIRKVTNTYWFWLAISIGVIVYTITICYSSYWSWFSHLYLPSPETDHYQSDIISRAFLLNLCPFCTIALPMCLIADPTRKAARALAPISLLTGFIIIFISIPFFGSEVEFSWYYIFVGSGGRPNIYFFSHATIFLLSLGVVLNTPKYGWKGTVSSYGTLAIIYIYVAIVAAATNCCWQVSGLNLNDFGPGGVYKWLGDLFNGNKQAAAAFFFPFFLIMMFILIVIMDTSKTKHFMFGGKYSSCWWRYYDYSKISEKEPWGWFSHQWQLKHPKAKNKLK